MSAQENGEAILYVIKRLFKWLLIGIFIIGIISFCFYLWITLSEWYEVGRHETKITVHVKFDKSECPEKDFPLSIFVGNASSKTIKHTSVYVNVINKGYSTKINNYSSFDSDKILKTNEGWLSCWSVESTDLNQPLNGENMEVSLDHFDVSFY